MKLLILNGPNLNLLGIREPDIYGKQTYAALEDFIRAECDRRNVECEIFQSNHEGVLVDMIQSAYGIVDGIVINPAAYTHTSVAILDALKAAPAETVRLGLNSANAPAVIFPADDGDESFSYMILPVRLRADA